jgi:hypothetical protein
VSGVNRSYDDLTLPVRAKSYLAEPPKKSIKISHEHYFFVYSQHLRKFTLIEELLPFAMERKRKIDWETPAPTPAPSSSSGNSSINPWTQRSYSSKYYEILTKRKQLPVYEFKDALEKAVKENQVVIVEGETGSGDYYEYMMSIL